MPKKTYDELLGFKKMQEISLERLTPPISIASEKDVSGVKNTGGAAPTRKAECITSIQLSDDSKLGIDYETIARSSEFQRFIYYLLTGKTHRGKQKDLRSEVKVKMNKFRGSGMGAVINEFKDKVARLRNNE